MIFICFKDFKVVEFCSLQQGVRSGSMEDIEYFLPAESESVSCCNQKKLFLASIYMRMKSTLSDEVI